MPTYKGIRCAKCDSVILAHMPWVQVPPSGDTSLLKVDCPECQETTVTMITTGGLKKYSMSEATYDRGYAKRGEWQEV